MLVTLTDTVAINPESIESIQEKQVLNAEHIPAIPGYTEGNNQDPVYTNVYIRTNTGDEIVIKNTSLSKISENLRLACK